VVFQDVDDPLPGEDPIYFSFRCRVLSDFRFYQTRLPAFTGVCTFSRP